MNKSTIISLLATAPDGVSHSALQRESGIFANVEFSDLMTEIVETGEVLVINRGVDGNGHKSYIHVDNVTAIHETKDSAGADVFANEDVTIKPNDTVIVSSSYLVPQWVRNMVMVAYLALPRSSYWGSYKLLLTNGVGLIDKDFNKHVGFSYHNFGDKAVNIKAGDKVGQLVMFSMLQFGAMGNRERTGGWGHTDTKEEKDVQDDKVVDTKTELSPPPPPPTSKK
tara:strand:- start:3294 stop:3968 length:675 start_codon:yes stop_codon:yes gene_type:complete